MASTSSGETSALPTMITAESRPRDVAGVSVVDGRAVVPHAACRRAPRARSVDAPRFRRDEQLDGVPNVARVKFPRSAEGSPRVGRVRLQLPRRLMFALDEVEILRQARRAVDGGGQAAQSRSTPASLNSRMRSRSTVAVPKRSGPSGLLGQPLRFSTRGHRSRRSAAARSGTSRLYASTTGSTSKLSDRGAGGRRAGTVEAAAAAGRSRAPVISRRRRSRPWSPQRSSSAALTAFTMKNVRLLQRCQ